MSAEFRGDNTNGSTMLQGSISAEGNLHLGNINHFNQEHENNKTTYDNCVRDLLHALPDDPSDYRDSLITRKGRWLEGTCEWLLETTQYKEWLNVNTPTNLLWITGGPGKGKTMLSLFLLDQHEHEEHDGSLLIHFFCGAQNGRNTGASVLRGLLYQLLTSSKDMFEHVGDAYAKHGSRLFEDDRFEAMWKVFRKMINHTRIHPLTCIIDGPDECIEESLEPLWVKLRSLAVSESPRPVQKSTTCFRLVITSRNYPLSFEHHLRDFPRIRLDSEMTIRIEDDIAKYVNSRMEKLPCSFSRKPTLHLLRDNVRKRLVQKANGTYLWVNFAITSLKSKACPELETAIDNFPRGLDGMYRRLVLNIPSSERAVVVSLLRWVTTVFTPLTLQALGAALELPCAVGQTLSDAVKDFIDYAGGLLVVTSSHYTEIVVVIHASLVDFLQNIDASPTDLSGFRLDSRYCHQIITARLMGYIEEVLRDDENAFWAENISYAKYALLLYGIRSCLRHLDIVSQHYSNLAYPLLQENHIHHQTWLGMHIISPGYVSMELMSAGGRWDNLNFHILHAAALGGHDNLINYFLNRKSSQVNIRDFRQRSPLFYAVLGAHRNTVSLLLRGDADPNATDCSGITPLHLACAGKDEKIIAMLLAVGADPNAYAWQSIEHSALFENPHFRSSYPSGTALHFAAHASRATSIEILLDYDAEVNIKDKDGQMASRRWLSYSMPDTRSIHKHYRVKALQVGPLLPDIMERDAVFAIDTDGHTAYESVLATWEANLAQYDKYTKRYCINKGDGIFDEYEGSLAHIVSQREGLTPAHELIKTYMIE